MNSQTFYRKIVAFAILVISFQIPIQTKLLAQNSSLILLKADTTLANEYFVRASQLSKESKFDSSTIYFRKASKIFRNLARKSDAKVHWVNFVKCHNNIARNYRINGEFEEALQTLDEALRIGRLKLGVMNLQLADSFEEKARIYDILGKRVEALSLMDTTVTILEEKTLNENDPRLGIAYDVIGIIYIRKGEFEKALSVQKKALHILQAALGENDLSVATVYMHIAVIYNERGQNREALKFHKKALEIKKNLGLQASPEISKSYNGLGIVYGDLGDYDKALEFHHKALTVRSQVLGMENPNLAGNYNNIGAIYLSKNDFDKALEFFNKALIIGKKAYGDSYIGLANMYNNIGLVYYYKGDLDEGLEFHHRALSLKRDILGERHPSVASSYSNIGIIERLKGNYDLAMQLYNKALSIEREKLGEMHPEVALRLSNIGNIYFEKGDYTKALEFHEKALSIREKVLPEHHPAFQNSYTSFGQIFLKIKDYEKASEFFNKDLRVALHSMGPNNPAVAESYINLGEVQRQTNELQKSLALFQKAITTLVAGFTDTSIHANPPLKNILSKKILLQALAAKAEVLARVYSMRSREIKDLQASQATYTLAADLIANMRSSYRAEGSKLFLGEEYSKSYYQSTQTALKLYDLTKDSQYKRQAFKVSEKGKSAVLWQSLSDSRAKEFANIPIELWQKERDLKIDLAYYDTAIQKEKQKKDDRDTLKIVDFEKRFFDLNREYEALIADLEKNYPKYHDLKYQAQTASVKEVQGALDDNTALIEYSVGDTNLVIFVISKNQYDVINIRVDSTFAESVSQFTKSIKKINRKAFLLQSQKLYATLIQPIEPHLQGKRKLVIIPDGMLHYLPFEALVSPNQFTDKATVNLAVDFSKLEYLVKRFEISYHHSATMFLNEQLVGKGNLAGSFIGFAPVFSDDSKNAEILETNRTFLDTSRTDEAVRSATIDGVRLNELKHSEDEVKAIVDLFKGSKRPGLGYFHSDASEENFKANVGDYQYVHIATHGLINEDEPKLSGLVFSQPSDSTYKEDGILYSGETYNLDLNADLVVLSSCESGIGKLVKGEGLMALTRGFLYAGTANIIFSLWKVSDRYTRDLMLGFYRQVVDGKSYAQALQQAKLKMIGEKATAFPSLWSSFVLVGP